MFAILFGVLRFIAYNFIYLARVNVTLGTLLAYTRFPVVLVMTASILLRIGALDSKNDYTKNHSKVKHKFEKCAIF